jgi:ABC-type multidrug transport system fused ATPase/permease subunit
MIESVQLLSAALNQAAVRTALDVWLKNRRDNHGSKIVIDGEELKIANNLSAEQARELWEKLNPSQSGDPQVGSRESSPERPVFPPERTVANENMGRKADALSRRLILGGDNTAVEVPSDLGGVALGSSSEFYAASRRRISLAFRLSVGLALALAIILFGGIAATIVSGLMGNAAWSATFGGVSAASLLGTYAYKPLAAISEAAVASQRLEILHARLANQLRACAEQPDPDKRMRCQSRVWNTIQKEVAAMSASVR